VRTAARTAASETVLEREMLKTRIDERDMSVTTFLNQGRLLRHAWTAVWSGPHEAMVWLHFWQGRTMLGGRAEAHEAVVSQVKAGTLPARAVEPDHD
jgi:hypothetical protein